MNESRPVFRDRLLSASVPLSQRFSAGANGPHMRAVRSSGSQLLPATDVTVVAGATSKVLLSPRHPRPAIR